MDNAKLFIYPKDFKFTRGLRQRLMKAGYILVPEDRAGSIRVIEPLPDLDVTTDAVWLMKTLLNIVLTDESYRGARDKFAKAMLKQVESRYGAKPELKAVEKAS